MASSLRRIAVLNRGDSATRCMRAIRELRAEEASELAGIALYTDPDRFAPFVLEADESLSLGPALRGQAGEQRVAYLDQERVLAALRAVRADAVWPGWGFLAEDPTFVERVEAHGIAFLGPRSETVRLLGDKLAAKRLAEDCSVPVLPWSRETVERPELRAAAERVGFPLVLKAAAGGGGRGIRKVERAEDLDDAFHVATKEALHAFGDGRVFLEACALRARHIEVQIAADQHGRVIALGMRDCSVQRNHQKVVEEGPPPGLAAPIREQICEASVRLARKAGYVGVGTCEFLLQPDGRFAFLEVNPRLQVEHGVTEMLTGVDLVKWQIRIARGEPLPDEVPDERGHAIEVRVCAEDPSAGFAPSPGAVEYLELPAGPGVRVDCGLAVRGPIPAEFDSMVAKVIGYGATRAEARARVIRAVSDLRVVVSGGMLNKGFLLDILAHPEFATASYHTQWLESSGIAREPTPRIEVPLVAAILSYQRERAGVRESFFAESSRGRPRQIPPSTGREIDLVYSGCAYRFRVYAIAGYVYRAYLGERAVELTLQETGPQLLELTLGGRHTTVLYSESEGELRIEIDGRLHRVRGDMGGRVRAPAPALVIEVSVEPGEVVAAGQRLGLLEAMKTETAFFAPVAGTVREVSVRPSERVDAGDVLLVIEPSAAGAPGSGAACLLLPAEADSLDALFDPETGLPDLPATSRKSGAVRAQAIRALRAETRRVLMGYDVNAERAERLMSVFEAPVHGVSDSFRSELVPLSQAVEIYGDMDLLFGRMPSSEEDELGPSNDARMAMYLRRIDAEGAGIQPAFLDSLRRALAHYEIPSLEPTPELERAVLRLWATRTTQELRNRLIVALLHLMLRLAEDGERFARHPEFEGALARLAELRGTVPPGVADLAAQVRYLIFERPRTGRGEGVAIADEVLALTLVPPPDEAALAARAAEVGISVDEARRIELWRLDNFDLERVETFPGVYTFYGRARDGSGDERLFCFSEVLDLGDRLPDAPDLQLFEQRFHQAIEGLRSLQAIRDPSHRMGWNRLYVFVRPALVLSSRLLRTNVRRLSPETGHLGIERVIVRLAAVDPDRRDATPRRVEVLSGNPTGSHVETTMRAPHDQPLAPATGYERRVAAARGRGLTYPYELVRLFTAAPDERPVGPGAALAAGEFQEYDLVEGEARPVEREPGRNSCGIVFGMIRTPTVKYPEGMRRVLILGDSYYGMGALAAPECDRIVAALDLAERERLPVEWVTVSSGAKIALDSGTENLDATARVVRKLVTFTDQGGEVNIIVAGVNVGAQSYFDALATMGLQSRGILVLLTSASMVLTGRLSLVMSGAVAAEDDVGTGGYERIMGPSGQAQYQARNMADAYRILLEHYACSYVMPGESEPRRFASRDPLQRDITKYPYDGDEGFETIGELFSSTHNLERKRPFAMRPLMRALIDQDGGLLERWRDWVGAETAIVWDAHLGGVPVTLLGVESRSTPRVGHVPNDGPDSWTAGTLFPLSSKKIARALNAASGVRPAVMLANLSGFDGSPESMRRGVLELGAEIARAVVRFRGPFLFTVVSRYHGGAYVVFSRELNEQMRATSLAGSFASVIGGSAAAAVIFPRDVRKRANDDPRVREAAARLSETAAPGTRIARRAEFERILEQVRLEKQAEMGAEFDAVHSIERALKVGSIESILQPETLRASLIGFLKSQ